MEVNRTTMRVLYYKILFYADLSDHFFIYFFSLYVTIRQINGWQSIVSNLTSLIEINIFMFQLSLNERSSPSTITNELLLLRLLEKYLEICERKGTPD